MPDIALTPDARPVPIPVRELLPWAFSPGSSCYWRFILWVRATSLISGMYVHEFVHDGRHLLAFPCH